MLAYLHIYLSGGEKGKGRGIILARRGSVRVLSQYYKREGMEGTGLCGTLLGKERLESLKAES